MQIISDFLNVNEVCKYVRTTVYLCQITQTQTVKQEWVCLEFLTESALLGVKPT